MNTNLASRQSLESEWNVVNRMGERVRHLAIRTFALDEMKSPIFGGVLYNLPLGLAYSVLAQALIFARDESQFTSSKLHLGDLMDSAKSALPWINWQRLREGVRLRDEGKLFGDKQCLQLIEDIESQLLAWNMITVTERRRPESVGIFPYAS